MELFLQNQCVLIVIMCIVPFYYIIIRNVFYAFLRRVVRAGAQG